MQILASSVQMKELDRIAIEERGIPSCELMESAAEAVALDHRVRDAWSGHPHHVIIDNSTDFDGKLERLLSVITAFLEQGDNA